MKLMHLIYTITRWWEEWNTLFVEYPYSPYEWRRFQIRKRVSPSYYPLCQSEYGEDTWHEYVNNHSPEGIARRKNKRIIHR